MTSGPSENGRADDEILAAEYVIGASSGESRAAAERRIADDLEFARRVRRWEAMLASFNDDYGEAAPPKAAFAEIERRLFDDPKRSAGLWNSIAFWRSVAFATSATAIAAMAFSFGPAFEPPAGPPLVARLSAPDSNVALLAAYDQKTGVLKVTPAASGGPQEKSLELWLVPGSGQPKSLGIFKPSPEGVLVIPEDRRAALVDGATLAVSVEPFGGSPTGLPTGPIIASGSVARS